MIHGLAPPSPRTDPRSPVLRSAQPGYTIGFERYTEHADMTPLFVGLPDDKCQSPHWGYVFKGKLVYHTPDGDIEITDGEAYYVGPGHTRRSSRTPRSWSSARPPSSTRR
jgi:hypothetical protein